MCYYKVIVYVFLNLFFLVHGNLFTGIATRYYDCCKPSCAWPGKVLVPGRSCYRNGTVVKDPLAVSGCNGGVSFACNTNTPFSVNSNMSYGFAAASIVSQTEKDWCCACYQLTFTSGPVVGKKMIVQITNTGYDLQNNHFDLEIPGGGQGIFKGCSSQYTNYYGGADYGGISQRSECSRLPKSQRQGCFWRFDWFKNADNPNVIAQKIMCPKKLVALSGCRRD
ncbi:hypothetical protein EB118_23685 [bacterium]|nr:hypothetical protein [bacterium]NDD83082.1 hypothetical protein [bacterium]NDG33056.1 hypothetical protein [bacterium]